MNPVRYSTPEQISATMYATLVSRVTSRDAHRCRLLNAIGNRCNEPAARILPKVGRPLGTELDPGNYLTACDTHIEAAHEVGCPRCTHPGVEPSQAAA